MTDYVFNKIIFFGDEGVGSTTLIKKYCIGGDYRKALGVRLFKLKPDMVLLGCTFNFNFWDIPVKGPFRSLRRLYCEGAEGAIFMYDTTNEKSLSYFPDWFYDIRSYSGNIPVMLVGNKIYRKKKNMASKKHIMMLKEEFDLSSLLEISVKSEENVYNMFEDLIRIIIKR